MFFVERNTNQINQPSLYGICIMYRVGLHEPEVPQNTPTANDYGDFLKIRGGTGRTGAHALLGSGARMVA